MTRKRKKFDLNKFKKALPYVIVGGATLVLVSVGSIDKQSSEVNLSLSSFAADDYSNVSIDQLSELYTVADLSDALRLASAGDVASNYVITNTMRDSGQTASGKLEKPNITDVAASRGIVEYEVGEGEDANTIAAKFGLDANQVRWSNGLKTAEIPVGTILKLPSTPGIVYTVKADDSLESIAEKYGSSVAEIVALNDLEVSGLSDGMQIVIKDGTLPETERPEYVAPVVVRPTSTYTYTYLGSTSERQNIEVIGWFYNLGGPYGAGQCTQWAWYKRGGSVPSTWGNANSWAYSAAADGYVVNRTPSAGAIFQTSSGWAGHVGYVEAVNPDGSIVVSEMNYGIPYRAIRSTIPASAVGNFNYIH